MTPPSVCWERVTVVPLIAVIVVPGTMVLLPASVCPTARPTALSTVTEFVVPSTVKLRVTDVAGIASRLLSVEAVELERLVPDAIDSVPIPTGPLTKAVATPVVSVVTLVLAPICRPPALTVTPPPKVLAPLSARMPLPVLLMPVPATLLELETRAERLRVGVTLAISVSALTVTGAILKVRVVPFRSRAPTPEEEISEMLATLLEVASIPPVSLSTPVPSVSVGAVPPLLLKVRAASVWLKLLRSSAAWPLRVGLTVKLIWLAARSWTLAELMIRSPAGIATRVVPLALPTEAVLWAFSWSTPLEPTCPPLMTVPPV